MTRGPRAQYQDLTDTCQRPGDQPEKHALFLVLIVLNAFFRLEGMTKKAGLIGRLSLKIQMRADAGLNRIHHPCTLHVDIEHDSFCLVYPDPIAVGIVYLFHIGRHGILFPEKIAASTIRFR